MKKKQLTEDELTHRIKTYGGDVYKARSMGCCGCGCNLTEYVTADGKSIYSNDVASLSTLKPKSMGMKLAGLF